MGKSNDYKTLVARGLLNPPPEPTGRYQWGIYTTKDVTACQELFCEGDLVRITSDGGLEILRKRQNRSDGFKDRLLTWAIDFLEGLRGADGQRYQTLLLIPKNKWRAAYLTDPISGEPVSVHDWPEIGIHIEDWIQRGGR